MESKNSAVILEKIREDMYVVFDESRAGIIVLAADIETASEVFETYIAIKNGDIEYLRNAVIGLNSAIKVYRDWSNSTDSYLLRQALNSLAKTPENKSLADAIGERLSVGIKLSRNQRRMINRSDCVVAKFKAQNVSEKQFDFP